MANASVTEPIVSPWMDHKETAAYLRVKPQYLYNHAKTNGIPRHLIPQSDQWRYRRDEVDRWLMGDNGSNDPTPADAPPPEDIIVTIV